MIVFSAELTKLPPSANKMYIYTKHGPVASKAAKAFKNAARVELARQLFSKGFTVESNMPYRLELDFYLPKLQNKGWPKSKTRYVRKDVSNLIKVTEDLVADCLGIDDSCFIEVLAGKFDGNVHGFEGVKIRIVSLEHRRSKEHGDQKQEADKEVT